MRENFSINEILEAVDTIVNSKTKKLSYNNENKENKNNLLPVDTEKIISQAEDYIKKK